MPKWEMNPVSPESVSIALPDRVVTNAELCQGLDTTPEWIEEKTGIKERRFLNPDESVLDIAVEAAAKALRSAGTRASDVDVLIVASTTPDWLLPSLGVGVAHRIGVTSPRILDITQHACSSVVYAMYTAACMLQQPGLDTALIVCAERGSGGTDPHDRTTRVFFGDAAGATVLRKSDGPGGLLSYALGNVYSHALQMPAPWRVNQETDGSTEPPRTPYLHMDGGAVLREAVGHLPPCVLEALSAAGMAAEDVSGFALHQASARLLQKIGRVIGADAERIPITAETLGNTASVSPLTSLWQLAREGRAKRDDVIVIGAIGAGFLFGALCFKLPQEIAAA